MWQVMISSAMGQNQYFHGIDWDSWKPRQEPEEEIDYDKLTLSERKAIAARHMTELKVKKLKDIYEQNKMLILNALPGIKRPYTSEIAKAIGKTDVQAKHILSNMEKDRVITKHIIKTSFGRAALWYAKKMSDMRSGEEKNITAELSLA
jgi:hypothetical protein